VVTDPGRWPDRLQAAAGRIRVLTPAVAPERLSDPDQATGERWDRGQILAHVAEMLPYWVGVIDRILAGGDGTPFGRDRTDPSRVGPIERDRHSDPDRLLDRMDEGVALVRARLAGLGPADLERTGRHPARGEVTVAQIVEDYLVGHLEEHADQLDG
jgi:hypothetical protein